MLRKTLLLISVPISFLYLKGQDVSVITNTIDVYSNSSINGTSKFNAMAGSMGALGGDISSSFVNINSLWIWNNSFSSFSPKLIESIIDLFDISNTVFVASEVKSSK